MRLRKFCLLPVLMGFSLLAATPGAQKVVTLPAQPLSFEPNRGQAAPEVEYLSRGKSSTLFLTRNKAVLSLHGTALEMRLRAANPAPRLEGTERLPGAVNYFIGDDQSQWRSSVPRFARVRYHNLYPGIDLAFYGNEQKLEYDLIVAPGADPQAIRMEFAGHRRASIDANGDLVLRVGEDEVRQHRPIVYQERNGRRETLDGRYVLTGRTVSFKLAKYDTARPLVIDPVLSFSTYLGGAHNDTAAAIAADAAGNTYVVGVTVSDDFPTTVGAFLTRRSTGNTAYVTKIAPDGRSLVYSTYLGSVSSLNGIAVDSTGNAYITGVGNSGTPVTSGAIADASQGSTFVTKLNPDGTKLIYSTFIQGGSVVPWGIAIDSAGAAYLAGETGSLLKTTPGAFMTTYPGGTRNAFAAKINADGKSLGYITFLGGKNGVNPKGALAVDASGNLHIVGNTASTDLPTTPGAAQSKPGGLADGYVFKLNATGSSAMWGTYLGGTASDVSEAAAIDGSGNLYVAGEITSGQNFPVTGNAYRNTCTGCTPTMWLVKYNPQGAVVFSTLVGPGSVQGLALDSFGNSYVAGTTYLNVFPTTRDAYKPAIARTDGTDAVLAKISADGSTLMYGTYFGGSKDDTCEAIAVDPNGNIYITGLTKSKDLPLTANVIQTRAPETGIDNDTYVAKFLQPKGPQFTADGIVNAASFRGGAVAPGEIITIYGAGIGPDQLVGYNITNSKFDNAIAQTRVLFDGVAAPIIYVSTGQTAIVVPYSVAGKQTTQVVIEYQGVQSDPVPVPVGPVAPGIFTALANGSGQAAVLNENYTVNGPGNRIDRGHVIMVFMTAGGELGQDGVIADGIKQHPLPVTAKVGGVDAQVIYAGAAPGLIWGVTQVNIVVPNAAPPSDAAPLTISLGGIATQGNVTIGVQ